MIRTRSISREGMKSMLDGLCRRLAEWITPDGDVAWRWQLKAALLRKTGMKLDQRVAIDTGFFCLQPDQLRVLDDAVIGKNVRIYNFSPVEIGKFCMFAGEVLISNGGHDKNTFEPHSGPIRIGNGCWIGTAVNIVGSGISVGDNCIVGAGSLVIEDVPAGAIVAGVPAKIIGYRDLPDKVWHLGGRWFSPTTFEKVCEQ